MSITRWHLNYNGFDYNPSKDTGWLYEEVRGEQHPIGANFTILQSAGFKSATRTIEGLTKSKVLHDNLLVLQQARIVCTCQDQYGEVFQGRVLSVEYTTKIDVSNPDPAALYQAWEYKITVMRV